jgi:hypothetical protein
MKRQRSLLVWTDGRANSGRGYYTVLKVEEGRYAAQWKRGPSTFRSPENIGVAPTLAEARAVCERHAKERASR